MRLLGIADDLTGALEAGALLGAVVRFQAPLADSSTTVIDIESRHLTPDGAAAKVFSLAPECRRANLVYKKTDSTLRGNIEAEFRALAEILEGSHTAYIPAYPAMGRTVRLGRLYVYGVPLETTQFAQDPLNPVTDGAVPGGVRCRIFDGETDEHVAEAVRLALCDRKCRIIAGPASVARELARQLDLSPAPLPRIAPIRTCLLVNGSLHQMSSQQVSFARNNRLLTNGWRASYSRMGCDVAAQLASSNPDALIVFGGDTAFDLISALGSPALHPLGEIVTGVPVSRIEGHRTILITKAGGFGNPELLATLKELLDDQQ